ncbi:MAG: hypothetical protein ACOCUL_03890, partial [Bacteroidota bacterium]
MERKIIKNIAKGIIVLALILLIIPFSLYFTVKHPRVQAYLVNKITTEISKTLNTKVELQSIEFSPFNKIVLNNIFVEDYDGDTLLYSGKVYASLYGLNIKERKIRINKAEFDSCFFRLYNDSSNIVNIKYVIDQLTNNNKKKGVNKPWQITLNKIDMKNSRFALENYYRKDYGSGIDWTDLQVYNMNLRVRHLDINKDTVQMQVRHLSGTEQTGFDIKKLSTLLYLHKNVMYFDNVSIVTEGSRIYADKVHFDFDEYKDFGDFVNKVKMDNYIRRSKLTLEDLSYFAPVFKNFEHNFIIGGSAKGTVSDLKIKNLTIEYGQDTRILGKVNFLGLPNIKETLMFVDLEDLSTNMSDIEKLNNSIPSLKHIDIPEKFHDIGNMHYKGNFTGFIHDFVAYGNFYSSLGHISTDLLIKPDTANFIRFKGKVSTNGFQLGNLIDNKNVGSISLNTEVNGYKSGSMLKGFMNGVIKHIDLKDYRYQNIQLKGILSNKTFDGSFSIEDPNIKLDFAGNFDFSGMIPEFNFTSKVSRANLYYLNLDHSDSLFNAAFSMTANFKGMNLDDLDGEILLEDITLEKQHKNLEINMLAIKADTGLIEKEFTIRSDLLDATLRGDYKFTTLINIASNITYNYIPALNINSKEIKKEELKRFTFEVDIKNEHHLEELFVPGFFIAENSTLKGGYDDKKKAFSSVFETEKISYRNNSFHDFAIFLGINDTIVSINSRSSSLELMNQRKFENFLTRTKVKDNNMDISCMWNNNNQPITGNLAFNLDFAKKQKEKKTTISLEVMPGKLVFGKDTWKVRNSMVFIDGSTIFFDNVRIANVDQSLSLLGAVSEKEDDTLFVYFHDFELSIIDEFIRNE